MIKKIILWFLLTVLIVLAILSYIGYRSFNQEAFKNHIVSSLQEITGRTFTVNGPYALTWDPLPTMTLENVTLSNIENSPNEHMFKADKIQIQIEWASLLKSPTRIKNIILINPEILVERISRSVTNINFPHLLAADDTLSTDTMLGEPKKQAKIDNIHIENGSFQYINQMSKQSYQLTQLTGEVAVGSLSGPFRFDGQGSWHNLPLQINLSVGSHEVSKPVDFLVDVRTKESNSHLTLDGKLFTQDTEKYLSGHASFETQKPNTLLRQLGFPLIPESNNKPSVGTMAFETGPTKQTLSDIVFKLGDGENDPAININFTHTYTTKTSNVILNVNALNLDEWQNTLKAAMEQKMLSGNQQIQFEINIANIIWNKQPATTLALNGLVANNQIKLEKSSVLLPGPTTIQMDALIGTDLNQWSGLAQINLQSQDFQKVVPFLKMDQTLTQLTDKIQKAEFSLASEWTPTSTTLTFPAIMLDDTTGIAEYTIKQNAPTELIVELNNINLNNYIQEPQKQSSLDEVGKTLLQWLEHTTLPPQTIDLDLTLNKATLKEALFENIAVNISTDAKNLKIEGVASTEQDDFVIKTAIQNMGTPDWQLVDNAWKLETTNFAQLLRMLGITTDTKFVQAIRSLNATGGLTGNKNIWNILLSAEAQNFTLQAEGTIENQRPVDLAVRFTHTSVPHLLVDMFEQNPLPLLNGNFEGMAIFNQTDDWITMSDVTITADNQTLTGEMGYHLQDHTLHTSLNAKTLDIAKFLPDFNHFYLSASGFDSNPFQLDLLKQLNGQFNLKADTLIYQTNTFKNAVIQLHIDNNAITLNDFVATGSDNPISTVQARGEFSFAQTPTFNLKLATQQLPLTTPVAMFDGVGISGGLLTSEWNLTSSGETPLQMARTLSGNGSVRLDNATFIGADLSVMMNIINQAQERDETKQVYEPKLKHALTNGTTPVDLINGSFTINDGVWQLTGAQLTTKEAATSGLNVTWDIPAAIIKASAPLQLEKYPALPSLVFNLQKDKRGLTYDLNVEAFANALVDEFAHQKEVQQEKAIQEKKEQLAQELNEAKQQALSAQNRFENLLNQMEKQVSETPDVNAQRGLKSAQVIHQNLATMMQEKDLTTTQYQYITEQTEKALAELKKVQNNLFAQNTMQLKKKASSYMAPASDMILKLNEMYQKRPTLTLLADLLQNAEKQREIMSRAIAQLDKDLTYDQIIKVADIIKSAHDKIAKAYGYAEELYSGRQSLSGGNVIKKSTP